MDESGIEYKGYLHPDNWIWYETLKELGLEKVAEAIHVLEKHKYIASGRYKDE